MDKIKLSFIFSLIFFSTLSAQIQFEQSVSIDTNGILPDASAMLHVESNAKGILIPRMSSTDRIGISSPAHGLLVYDEDSESFWYHRASGWIELVAGTSDKIIDTDGDTKVLVEKSMDDDLIHFDLHGTEFFRMDSGRLDVLNTGGSIFIGEEAGLSDDFTNNQNIGIGRSALTENMDGYANVGIGATALFSNIDGHSNTAIGYQSLRASEQGNYNTALGYRTLYIV